VRTWVKVLLVTIVLGLPTVVLGQMIWPSPTGGPEPTSGQLGLFVGLSLFDAVAWGLGIAWLLFALPRLRRIAGGSELRAWAMYLSILERGDEGDGPRRLHAQPHADVLGKKILEWSSTPEHAYATALYLNNKYFVDGHDPNSFANVTWVFGKVRYMSAGGLERKGNPEEYVEKVERLIEAGRAEGL
jgi:hypothetical protein